MHTEQSGTPLVHAGPHITHACQRRLFFSTKQCYGTVTHIPFQAQKATLTEWHRTPLSVYCCQVDGLVGAKEVLKLVPEKAVFLAALHPRDCLRLLGLVSCTLGDCSALCSPCFSHSRMYPSLYASTALWVLERLHV